MRLAREENIEIPLASLIDIVFLLIIFFVVTTNLQKDVADHNVKLAESYYIPPETESLPPEAIVINVVLPGNYDRGGRPYYTIGGLTFRLGDLKRLLLTERARFGNQIPIIIRADRRTLYKDIQRVNDVIGAAGLYRVSHVARDESGKK